MDFFNPASHATLQPLYNNPNQLTLHILWEGSHIYPHNHTGVVQTIVGSSQIVRTSVNPTEGLESDTGVAISYSCVIPGFFSIPGPLELLGKGECLWILAKCDCGDCPTLCCHQHSAVFQARWLWTERKTELDIWLYPNDYHSQ